MNALTLNFVLVITTTVVSSFAILLLLFYILRYFFIQSRGEELTTSSSYSVVRQHAMQFANGIQHCSTKIDSDLGVSRQEVMMSTVLMSDDLITPLNRHYRVAPMS